MKENIKNLAKAIAIFLLIWLSGSAISLLFDIKNGLLPSLFLGASIAIWRYKKVTKRSL